MTQSSKEPVKGWQPVERWVHGPVLIDQAVQRVQALGFEVRIHNPEHVEMHRDGTQWTLRGERFPLDLTLSESEEGIFIQLRYAGLVLADTGDLGEVADQVATAVKDSGA